MQRFFDMSRIEKSMGGTAPPQFDFAAYEKQQLASPADVQLKPSARIEVNGAV